MKWQISGPCGANAFWAIVQPVGESHGAAVTNAIRIAVVRACTIVAALALVPVPGDVAAQSVAGDVSEREELAREAQNPLTTRISLAFQNNANFDLGAQQRTLDILYIQPVVPIPINNDWDIITRTALPLVSQPELGPNAGTIQGLSATQISLFASPTHTVGHFVLGAGPLVQLPTTTNQILGSLRWGAGPAIAALLVKGPWVVGGLVNNVWTFGTDTPAAHNIMTLQPILNYNFASGTYLTSAPSVRASWGASPGNRWVVPIGAGIGQIFPLGGQPVNAQIAAYTNVVRPTIGPDWQLRFQVQLLF